jgi:uncharacterized protein involved in response to NO
LLAAGLAALYVPLWALQYSGVLGVSVFSGAAWHGHEMVFGFAMAVIAGFLFTAVRNWTQQPTPSRGALIFIALLWVIGRVLVLSPWPLASALANAAFPWTVAACIAVPMARARNRRNLFFVALLAAAGLASLAMHLSSLGMLPLAPRGSLLVALDIVLFIVAVIAGRVVPMFTNNAIHGADAVRDPQVEKLALGSLLALLAADMFALSDGFVGVAAIVAAIAHGLRLARWRPWRTRLNPMVWILHASYAWIVAHFVLRALAAIDLVPATLATHALTVGAIGGMTLGMMTRTARGHSGRAIAADMGEVWCFALIQLAALVRVAGAIVVPSAYLATVAISAALWSAAFGWYFVRYWPVLTRASVA